MLFTIIYRFPLIENLEEFTGLKVLYFEGNGCSEISGLQNCVNLRSLYLQENLIKKIENLENCTLIANLNLSENDIKKIENLDNLKNLGTLQIKRNRLGIDGNSIEALKGLLEVPSISVLDISENKLDDENIVDEILVKIPNLAVLYLNGNELYDHPVFEEERRFAEAFHKGGLELEREERQKFKKEQEEAHLKNHYAFREMIERYKREAAEENENNQQQQQNQIQDQQQGQQYEQIPELEVPSNEERRSSFLNSMNKVVVVKGKILKALFLLLINKILNNLKIAKQQMKVKTQIIQMNQNEIV
ncbi:leucine rich repeat protein [Ichthyophthirius multifiliis]|uniref:Leucine rich repeat protein n=1 Tax=Ichthyophthirius multifiliis TaxID=5932 RepID=G0QPM5_ICHMU|nr:leucine rich repeat protein [Ichthyophthirius multifiliis]EGR32825.1 leucine rich repeat protein [Ichthyophthirius multifiliis]|eukprot:XP_004036811.1 leucine rich repeat protein [Ichthyophthirius multifiliis]